MYLPAMSYLLYSLGTWLMSFMDARDSRHLKRLEENKRKMVKDLKDSTHYEKTHILIAKYDPDARTESPSADLIGNQQPSSPRSNLRHRKRTAETLSPARQPRSSPASAFISQATAATAHMASSAAIGAGQALFPIFDKMANAIGDNPTLLENLRQAESRVREFEQNALTLAEQNTKLAAEVMQLQEKLRDQGALDNEPPQAEETLQAL